MLDAVPLQYIIIGAMSQRNVAVKAATGRRRLPSKREAILAAATRVFLESGYGAASMDHVAREAGVSKQTVYSHFGGKDALFGAIIQKNCDQLLEPILKPQTHGDDPRTALSTMARRFLTLVLGEDAMALLRAVVGEWGRFPELTKAFYQAGPSLALENLSHYLAEMNRKGILSVDDPKFAASLFFGMLRGDLYVRQLLGVGPPPEAKDIEHAVGEAVDVFLTAYARR